jgi:hypothetical protein
MTARTVADREAGLAAGLARLGSAEGGARASAAPDARRAGRGGEAAGAHRDEGQPGHAAGPGDGLHGRQDPAMTARLRAMIAPGQGETPKPRDRVTS